MPNSTEYHAEQLRLCASLGGQVEIHEPGCDEPRRYLASEILSTLPMDASARHAVRQARMRTLAAAADTGADLARLGRLVSDEVSLLAAGHAATFAALERNGGEIAYRVQR